MSSNQYWLSTTAKRSASVVRVHGFGLVDMCATAAGFTGLPIATRHADAAKPATAARLPWSPPVP